MADMARVDRASRLIPARRERVFGALVDPDALQVWLPPAGMTGWIERFDLRPGGSYRMVLTYDDGSVGKTTPGSDVAEVRFVDIRPPEALVQAVDFISDDPAFGGTMTMTWELTAVGDATKVEVRAEDVPSGISPEDHRAGMTASLDNLATYVREGDD